MPITIVPAETTMITPSVTITYQATIILSEVEARALDAICSYGTEDFIKKFYQHFGTSYLKNHEAGVHSLFNTIRQTMPPQLSVIDTARKLVQGIRR